MTITSQGDRLWKKLFKSTVMFDNEPRIPDFALIAVLGQSRRTVRRQIRRYAAHLKHFGKVPVVELPRGGRCWLLSPAHVAQLVTKLEWPAAIEMTVSYINTVGGLLSGATPSPNAEVTIALQDAAEAIDKISPDLRRLFVPGA